MENCLLKNELPALLVPVTSGVEVVMLNELIRIQSISNYSKFYFNNGRSLVVAKTLCCFEKQLRPYGFLRIHRTHLINPDFVSRYHKGLNAEVELMTGLRIKIARRKKKEIGEKLYSPIIRMSVTTQIAAYV